MSTIEWEATRADKAERELVAVRETLRQKTTIAIEQKRRADRAEEEVLRLVDEYNRRAHDSHTRAESAESAFAEERVKREAERAACDGRVWPIELTPVLSAVLGMVPWVSGPIAHAYRADGHAIAPKMEAEQAFVLHRAAGLALEHGEKWREVMLAEIDEIHDRVKAPALQTDDTGTTGEALHGPR